MYHPDDEVIVMETISLINAYDVMINCDDASVGALCPP